MSRPWDLILHQQDVIHFESWWIKWVTRYERCSIVIEQNNGIFFQQRVREPRAAGKRTLAGHCDHCLAVPGVQSIHWLVLRLFKGVFGKERTGACLRLHIIYNASPSNGLVAAVAVESQVDWAMCNENRHQCLQLAHISQQGLQLHRFGAARTQLHYTWGWRYSPPFHNQLYSRLVKQQGRSWR